MFGDATKGIVCLQTLASIIGSR